jgi:hypothetical protein
MPRGQRRFGPAVSTASTAAVLYRAVAWMPTGSRVANASERKVFSKPYAFRDIAEREREKFRTGGARDAWIETATWTRVG